MVSPQEAAVPTEIERKFLVKSLPDLSQVPFLKLEQGYLFDAPGTLLRIRTSQSSSGENKGILTIKGSGSLEREEIEFQIPLYHARNMLSACEGVICKTRYLIPHDDGQHLIELDLFDAPLTGLILAEIELRSTSETLSLPDWFGPEVTDNFAYSNSKLIKFGIPDGYVPPGKRPAKRPLAS